MLFSLCFTGVYYHQRWSRFKHIANDLERRIKSIKANMKREKYDLEQFKDVISKNRARFDKEEMGRLSEGMDYLKEQYDQEEFATRRLEKRRQEYITKW